MMRVWLGENILRATSRTTMMGKFMIFMNFHYSNFITKICYSPLSACVLCDPSLNPFPITRPLHDNKRKHNKIDHYNGPQNFTMNNTTKGLARVKKKRVSLWKGKLNEIKKRENWDDEEGRSEEGLKMTTIKFYEIRFVCSTLSFFQWTATLSTWSENNLLKILFEHLDMAVNWRKIGEVDANQEYFNWNFIRWSRKWFIDDAIIDESKDFFIIDS